MPLLDAYTGPWTETEAAHLARRAGFGARPTELTAMIAQGMGAAVDALVNFPTVDANLELLIASLTDDETTDLGRLKHPTSLGHCLGNWVYRMVHTTYPLREQLALFLHDTLVSEFGKITTEVPFNLTYGNDGSQTGQSCSVGTVPPNSTNRGRKVSQLMLDQIELYRTDGSGSYRQLLRKVTRNPAMLLYLDNYTNISGKAQENYAREVMELFSMGVGNYSEEDVREVARCFTGESVDRSCSADWPFTYIYNANRHDNGAKIVFGQTFNLGANDTDHVLDLIIDRVTNTAITPFHSLYPATAVFMSWKFLTWFVAEDIEMDDPAVGEMAAFFSTNSVGGDLFNVRELLRKLFKSQLFYDPQYRFKMYKNPADFVVMALRNLQLEETSWTSTLNSFMRDMGMQIFQPPNVAGWPQGEKWINSSTMINRFNYGDRLSGSSRMTDAYVDALKTNGTIAGNNDHAAMIEYFRGRLIQEPLGSADVTTLDTFLAGIGSSTTSVSQYRRKIRGLVHIFMSMPRYQLK